MPTERRHERNPLMDDIDDVVMPSREHFQQNQFPRMDAGIHRVTFSLNEKGQADISGSKSQFPPYDPQLQLRLKNAGGKTITCWIPFGYGKLMLQFLDALGIEDDTDGTPLSKFISDLQELNAEEAFEFDIDVAYKKGDSENSKVVGFYLPGTAPNENVGTFEVPDKKPSKKMATDDFDQEDEEEADDDADDDTEDDEDETVGDENEDDDEDDDEDEEEEEPTPPKKNKAAKPEPAKPTHRTFPKPSHKVKEKPKMKRKKR